jgi:hypothetical protein
MLVPSQGIFFISIQKPNDAAVKTLFQSCESHQPTQAVGAAEAKKRSTCTRQTMVQLGQLATGLDGCPSSAVKCLTICCITMLQRAIIN